MSVLAFHIPTVNASLNALATVLLVVGLLFIKQKKIAAHQWTMVAAFAVSCVFLVGYLYHKYFVLKGVHTELGAQGAIKTFYLLMLASHVVLAMAVPPLALMTIVRGWRRSDEQHRRLAKITWPIWFYVSVTGVLVYMMLYQWYPATGSLSAGDGL